MKTEIGYYLAGFTETLDSAHTMKLSSAGLIYKHFGKKVVRFAAFLTQEVIQEMAKISDEKIEEKEAAEEGEIAKEGEIMGLVNPEEETEEEVAGEEGGGE